MNDKKILEMRISLNALEHLGMNLYSNTPAVVSEIVANAWDADAENVEIHYNKQGSITVLDDGVGMTRDEVISRYLNVGYRRRTTTSTLTQKHQRRPMGRKGIGKLSCFSIANVVTVYTIKDGERTAFRLDANDIREQISANDDTNYKPLEIEGDCPQLHSNGTYVILEQLKRNINKLSQNALRQRVARRFSILGAKYNFEVYINALAVKPRDRGYLDKIEFLWTYGNQSSLVEECSNLSSTASPEDRTHTIAGMLGDRHPSFSFNGWIGTVETPNKLRDEERFSVGSALCTSRASEEVSTGGT